MRTEQAKDRLTGDLRSVVRDTAESVRASAGQAAIARNRLAAAVDAANATCQKVEDQTVAALKATDRFVRVHPYETISVAFGLGLMIGVLLGRR